MKNNTSILKSFIEVILFAVLIFFLFSCNDSMNEEKALNDVIAKYPNAKIYRYEEDCDFIFYVVDSNSLKIVRCQSFKNPYISSVQELKILK